MSTLPEQIADRVDLLLLRHQELQRINALLAQQLEQASRERDSLQTRLDAARNRLDAVLARLPADPAQDPQPEA